MRNAMVVGIAVMVVVAGAVIYSTHFRETASAEYPPVIVVKRGSSATTRQPAVVATATPAAPPTLAQVDAPPSLSQQRPLSDDVVPLVDMIGGSPRNMRDRLTNEKRDNEWATRSEALLQTSYSRLKGIGSAGRKIDVVCGLSVCQVSGSIANMPGGSTSDVMESVHSDTIIHEMAAKGYDYDSSSFGPGAGGRQMFVTYYKRIAPKPSS